MSPPGHNPILHPAKNNAKKEARAGWYHRLVGMEDCTVGSFPGTTSTTMERPLQRVPGGFFGSIPSLNFKVPALIGIREGLEGVAKKSSPPAHDYVGLSVRAVFDPTS